MPYSVIIDDELWAELQEMNGDAWQSQGHQELVVDTLLRIAIPIAKDKIDNGLPL